MVSIAGIVARQFHSAGTVKSNLETQAAFDAAPPPATPPAAPSTDSSLLPEPNIVGGVSVEGGQVFENGKEVTDPARKQMILEGLRLGVTLSPNASPAPAAPPPDTPETKVQNAYRTLLGREGEPEGLKHWTDFLNSGKSEQEMLDLFKQSPEYQQKHPSNLPPAAETPQPVAAPGAGIKQHLLDLDLEQLTLLLRLVPIDRLKAMSEEELKQFLQAKVEERAALQQMPFGGNLNVGGSAPPILQGPLFGNSDPGDFRVTGAQMAGFNPNMPAAAPWGMTGNPLFGGFMPNPFAGLDFLTGSQNQFGFGRQPSFSFL